MELRVHSEIIQKLGIWNSCDGHIHFRNKPSYSSSLSRYIKPLAAIEDLVFKLRHCLRLSLEMKIAYLNVLKRRLDSASMTLMGTDMRILNLERYTKCSSRTKNCSLPFHPSHFVV